MCAPVPTVLKKHWKLYAFLVPVFIPLIIFGYFPAVDAFKLAFTDNQSGAFVGLQNFIDMASDRKLIKSVGVMLKLLVAGLITGNIPALLMAELVQSAQQARIRRLPLSVHHPHDDSRSGGLSHVAVHDL